MPKASSATSEAAAVLLVSPKQTQNAGPRAQGAQEGEAQAGHDFAHVVAALADRDRDLEPTRESPATGAIPLLEPAARAREATTPADSPGDLEASEARTRKLNERPGPPQDTFTGFGSGNETAAPVLQSAVSGPQRIREKPGEDLPDRTGPLDVAGTAPEISELPAAAPVSFDPQLDHATEDAGPDTNEPEGEAPYPGADSADAIRPARLFADQFVASARGTGMARAADGSGAEGPIRITSGDGKPAADNPHPNSATQVPAVSPPILSSPDTSPPIRGAKMGRPPPTGNTLANTAHLTPEAALTPTLSDMKGAGIVAQSGANPSFRTEPGREPVKGDVAIEPARGFAGDRAPANAPVNTPPNAAANIPADLPANVPPAPDSHSHAKAPSMLVPLGPEPRAAMEVSSAPSRHQLPENAGKPAGLQPDQGPGVLLRSASTPGREAIRLDAPETVTAEILGGYASRSMHFREEPAARLAQNASDPSEHLSPRPGLSGGVSADLSVSLDPGETEAKVSEFRNVPDLQRPVPLRPMVVSRAGPTASPAVEPYLIARKLEDEPVHKETDRMDVAHVPPASSGATEINRSIPVHVVPAHEANRLAARVADIMAQNAGRQTEIALQPEELGRVRMKLTTAEQSATLVITADRPETLDLMRRHASDLAASLRAIGHETLSFEFRDGRNPASSFAGGTTWPDESGVPDDRSIAQGGGSMPAVPAHRETALLTPSGLDLRL